jgi:hypothetical protein
VSIVWIGAQEALIANELVVANELDIDLEDETAKDELVLNELLVEVVANELLTALEDETAKELDMLFNANDAV